MFSALIKKVTTPVIPGKMFCVLSLFLLIVNFLYAQGADSPGLRDTTAYPYWIDMMQDPEANYFSTVSAFEKYWENRPITKGCGWKVFKRWEYIMRGRITPDGRKPEPDAVYKEWQKVGNSNRSANGSWTTLGPAVIPQPGPAGYLGLGRLNVIAFHPSDQNKLYAGAPSGGFWLTTDNGATWTTTTDQMPTIGVSAIVVDFVNPQIIFMGTGDRDHGDAPGMGVFKSTDGGYNWNPAKTGMGNVTVCKIIQHPSNALILVAATTSGIFRTANGGSSWSLSATGDFKDICFKPGDPSIVYAESSSEFYRSSNNGVSFVHITSGLTSGQRGAIAVTVANPAYVYFLQSDISSGFKGVYRSTDSGLTFSVQSTTPNILDWSCDGSGTGGQGWYDLVITADPVNENTIYVGGVDVWKSVDGGISWTINSHWYGGCSVPAVHADCHFLGFSPVNGRLYAGNDGGIYYTSNGGTNWTDCTVGMTIGQIYKLGQSQTDGSKTINGFQDNGTYTMMSSGWNATGGGDGMECAVDFQNASITYHTVYFGSIFRKINNANEFQIAGEGVFGIDESGDWVTPFFLAENNPKTMFVGYKNVWWCPDATSSTPQWTRISEGELNNCLVLEQSPADVNKVYVVRWGALKRTENAYDASPVWISCTLPGGYTPTDLEAHPTEPNTIYATAGNKVYKSTDKGITWSQVPGTLPDVPVNTIVYDKNTNEGLYVGTQTTVFFKNASMAYWVNFGSGLPVVDVRELEIFYNSNPANNRLMACTFGRGLWRSDLYYPPNSPPVANFSVNPDIPCGNEIVHLTDLSLNNPITWTWSISPSSVTFLNGTTIHSQHPEIQFNELANYQITLLVTNSFGNSQITDTVQYGGPPLPMNETFESGALPSHWTINNPDGGITWNIATVAGNGSGSKSSFMECYNYYPGSGQSDEMILSPLSFAGSVHPWLSFKVAYCRWGEGYSDGLKVFASTDCGVTWNETPLYDKSGSTLATRPDNSEFFVPALPGDWRTDSIDLTNYINHTVTLKFQSINGWGNNIYIDDVSISEHPTLIVQNQSINMGSNKCFDALGAIRVAGNGTTFSVLNGGVAEFIAGNEIVFLQGVKVYSGGYMHGYINPSGPFCSMPALPSPSVYPDAESDRNNDYQESTLTDFTLFPNPTSIDKVNLICGNCEPGPLTIEIFDMQGSRIKFFQLNEKNPNTISLQGLPAGLYIVKMASGEKVNRLKLVKSR